MIPYCLCRQWLAPIYTYTLRCRKAEHAEPAPTKERGDSSCDGHQPEAPLHLESARSSDRKVNLLPCGQNLLLDRGGL